MSADSVIERLATPHYGVVSRVQLLERGVTSAQIKSRIRRGSLIVLHAGVYRTAGSRPSLEQAAVAACLACGNRASASHTTAARLWGLLEIDGPIHVTVPRSKGPKTTGVVVHRSDLRPSESAPRNGIRVTSVGRTVVDLARAVGSRDLALAVDSALRRRLIEPLRLLAYAREPRFDNVKRIAFLRDVVHDRCEHGTPESDLETRAVSVFTDHRLPSPTRQYEMFVRGRTVHFDFCYPDERLAIEFDGWGPHFDRWQDDHDRDNAIELGAWRLLKFTWRDVTERPLWVATQIADALGLVPSRWRKR